MIDIKILRADPEKFKQSLGRKRFDAEKLAQVLELDKKWRTILSELDGLKAEKNRLSKAVPQATPAERPELLAQVKTVSDKIKELEPLLATLEQELNALLVFIPNPPHASVPDGFTEEDSVTIKQIGEPRIFPFTPKDHAELGEINGIIDIPRASRTSGTRFCYLLNDAVLIQLALLQYTLDKVLAQGFKPVVPPVLVRESAMYGTGFFPADKNEIYKIEDEDHYLVGTSEVSIAAFHQEEIIEEEALPLRYTGISTCFRREAGSYGKDTRGIFRVHQFDKVEMFSFCHPDRSWEEHELILATEEAIVGGLGLPYRVLNICAGELGYPAAKKYDIEVWLPSQQKYREVTSCSNCTDFQARRLSIKTRINKKPVHLHTLNGTAVAIGRMLIALMENYQQEDGSILIPDCLKKYMLLSLKK